MTSRRAASVVPFLIALFMLGGSPAAAGEPPWLIPPVDGAITHRFDAPDSAYGSGHRGVDFAAAPGTAVRAAAPGVVTFAGHVAGMNFVTVTHEGALATTYSRLSEVTVSVGQKIGQGTWIGRTGESHGAPGLHFGVKRGDTYVDPEHLLGPVDPSRAINLVAPDEPALAEREEACEPAVPLEQARRAPNGNIAVAIAGIGTKTLDGVSADMYRYGPEFLGYTPDSIERFSYGGLDPSGSHRPYPRSDSWTDIRASALELGELLRHIALTHPDRHVDLIAHSQGGVVARTFLALNAQAFDPQLPQVDHLITFSSPHRGAPGAGTVGPIGSSVVGRIGLGVLSVAADHGAPLPDPLSPAVAQLAPGSELMDELGEESILFGTSALSLGIPFDAIVPADRAELPEEEFRIVPPHGLQNHSGVVQSPVARRLAYEFLRGATLPCPGSWDGWGPQAGRLIGGLEWAAGRAIGGPNWLVSLLMAPIAEPLL